MSLSLRRLLQNPSLHLRIVTGDGEPDDGGQRVVRDALDQEFEWLHVTDLVDPTKFLGPAEVILTLGWQFPITQPADESITATKASPAQLTEIYESYAALVAAHGVIGIGFGSDVIHKGIPRQLEEACRRHGLILFDVPYEISFMDLLQEAARVLQRDQTERYTRSLRAQKAIASAATRRDGLTATLRETARQLGCGVALYDPLGRVVTMVEAPDGPRIKESDLTPIVQQSLEAEQRFHSVQVTPEIEAVLQLLGEPGEPSGILVLTLSRGFDDVSRNVLSSVLALVSVSLEQNQALSALHGTLREALLQLILTGNIAVTRHIIESVWGQLPQPPLVALVAIPKHFDAGRHLPAIESMPIDNDTAVFFAQYREYIAVVINEADASHVLEHMRHLDLVIGQSRCDRWEGLDIALEEAKKAAEFGERRGNDGATLFSEIWREGLTDLIDSSDASHVARRLLGPVQEHDTQHDSALLYTLRIWLSHHGRHLPAARELEIHRHTLTHRLEQISAMTGLDLNDVDSRVEFSLALRYLHE